MSDFLQKRSLGKPTDIPAFAGRFLSGIRPILRESDPFPVSSWQPADFADTSGATAAVLGTLDPVV